MLDLPAAEVPHVFSKGEDAETGLAAMSAWLAQRGLRLVWVYFNGDATLDRLLEVVGVTNPGLPVMLGGLSRPGVGHFIVAQDGRVVCDPAPGERQPALVGPHDDGTWCMVFLGAHLT